MSVQIQDNFLTLAIGYLHMKNKTCFPQQPLGLFNPILYVSFKVQQTETCQNVDEALSSFSLAYRGQFVKMFISLEPHGIF